MPRLIIDQATMELVAAKLAGKPVFAGPNGDLLAPGVIDIVDDDGPGQRWQPGDERTRHLLLAADVCRDLALHARGFEDSAQRKRVIKTMTVPLCNLMEVVTKLLAELNAPAFRSAREKWPEEDRLVYRQAGKRLKRHNRGVVRKVRNKLGAHLDHDAIGDPSLKLPVDDLLAAMGDAVVLATLAINHGSEAFTWIRSVGRSADGTLLVVETMFQYPLCVRWITDLEGKVVDAEQLLLAADPRFEVQDTIVEVASVYNRMVSVAGSSLAKIHMVPTAKLLAAAEERLTSTDATIIER